MKMTYFLLLNGYLKAINSCFLAPIQIIDDQVAEVTI